MSKYLALSLLAICANAVAEEVEHSAPTMYTIDLFSILSFALAIAAFFVSAFLGWLSWQFYQRSSEVSEKTNEAVSRIEQSVSGIQSDITEIVRRAVGYWVGSTDEEVAPDQFDDVNEKIEQLRKQISELGEGKPGAEQIDKAFDEVVSRQRERLKELNASLLNAKVYSMFPSAAKQPAIELTQNITRNDKDQKQGQLIIQVTRSVPIATATGKFSPAFDVVPTLAVQLESSPYGSDDEVTITSGVGKSDDFNVHLRALNGVLKSGQYVVNYNARTDG